MCIASASGKEACKLVAPPMCEGVGRQVDGLRR